MFDTYDKIPRRLRPELKPTKHKFCTASGQEIKRKGEELMTLELGGKELYFIVMVGDVTSNLLGEDFIRHFECNFDFSSHEFVILLDGQKDFERKQNHLLQKFVTAEACYAPAGHEIICHIKFKNRAYASDGIVNELGILTPERKFVESHGLAVARTLVDTFSSVVYARILNPSDTTVKINKGTPIALLSPIAEVGQSFNFEDAEFTRPQKSRDEVSMDIPEHLKKMFEQGCQNSSEEQIVQFKHFVLLHQENFAKPGEVGRTNFGSHKINLKDEAPNKYAPRRIPVFKRDILDEEV